MAAVRADQGTPEIAAPPSGPTAGTTGFWVRLGLAVILLALAVALPQLYGQTTTKLVAQAFYLAVAAMGLNLLTGYNGQVSIGHGAFFGLGAYTSALLVANHGWNFYATLPVVAVVAAVLGAAVGFPALRVKGLYLALITLGLAALGPLFVTRFVHGSGGTTLVQPPLLRTPNWVPLSIVPQGGDDIWRYYVCLALVVLLFVLTRNLVRSRVGRAMIAIRDREVAAEAVGVNLAGVKVGTFAVSAAYAGLAGAMSVIVEGLAQSTQQIFFQNSITFLLAVVVGGAATLAGPLVGAFVITFLQKYIGDHSSNQVLSPAIFGGALIVLMYVLPDGIVGGGRRLIRSRRRSAPPTAGAVPPSQAQPETTPAPA